jgi:hypothetical protein
MSGESSEQKHKWALGIAAGICLITTLLLASDNLVGAATLTAVLFVVCVLLIYLPRMEIFKAWGIEAKYREVVTETGKGVRQTDAALEMLRAEIKDIKNEIAAGAPKENLETRVGKAEMLLTQASTSNNAVLATLSVVDPTFRATKGSN